MPDEKDEKDDTAADEQTVRVYALKYHTFQGEEYQEDDEYDVAESQLENLVAQGLVERADEADARDEAAGDTEGEDSESAEGEEGETPEGDVEPMTTGDVPTTPRTPRKTSTRKRRGRASSRKKR
jgi:hypothetical protein